MRPHPRRARTDPSSPRALGTSDHSGFIGNHEDLCWQHEWAGAEIINKRILVFPDELDTPQRQLGILILPPDPPTIMNARPENYAIDETPVSTRTTMNGTMRVTVSPPGSPLFSIRIVSGDAF
jgi:hypothetical protein